jgi:solute carrier family 6 (neurotransmitter transporter, GABA) member 1
MILGFTVAHIGMCLICLGFIMPRYYDVFVPPHRRGEGTEETVPLEPKGQTYARPVPDESGESGLEYGSPQESVEKAVKPEEKVASRDSAMGDSSHILHR